MDWNRDGQVDSSELRLTGLILAQSALIGVAVGVFDSGIWLPAGATGDSWVNGMTYSMAALAVQVLAYYLFKMFFEQGMMQRVNQQNMQRDRDMRLRSIQSEHEQRRIDMELRIQEMQLQRELAMFSQNPEAWAATQATAVQPTSQTITSTGAMSLGLDSLATNIPDSSTFIAPRSLDDNTPIPLKKDGTPDLRYKKGRGEE